MQITIRGPSTGTLDNEKLKHLSVVQKLLLLSMLCSAQFADSFNNSALFTALPALEQSMHMTSSQSVWIISAYRLTFASFLLISGRVSDVYNPRVTFICGISIFGLILLGTGFVNNTIFIIVLRALSGIAAAMTIPSALTLLVKAFPDPLAQARAIGVFGGCGALANILGVLIGAVFVQWASYHWTFWFTGIIAVSVGMSSLFVIPPHITRAPEHRKSRIAKLKSLDIIGVSILTVAMILFIFAITSGSTEGWADQTVLSTLITSIVLMIGFFYWETLLPVEKVAIPPRTWFYKNFAVLFTLTLLPFFWLTTVFTIFTNLWQGVFNLSAIWTAIHMLPIGVVASAMSLTGPLTRICSPKWIILIGLVMLAIATTLLALGGGNLDQYWTFVFPAFAIGSAGTMLTYTNANVLLFRAAPASMAGTVGAIFTGGLQMGSAIGLAAVSSIETSIEATHGGPDEYYGRAAAFWLLLSVIGVEIISFTCLYRRKADNQPQPESGVHDEGELTRCETSSEGERHTSTPTKAGLNEGETMAQMT